MFQHCICRKKSRRDSLSFNSTSVSSSNEEKSFVVAINEEKQRCDGFLKFLNFSFCLRGNSPQRKISMAKVERVIKATLLIQQWYRRYMARIEMKRRYTWTIFQNIEYSAEQDQVRLYNFFNDLITHMPKATKITKNLDQISVVSSEYQLPDDDEMVDEMDSFDEETTNQKNFKSICINKPLEKQDIETLINLFRKRKYRLHARYVAQILRESIKKLKQLANISKISTQGSKTVTVVGDLHGKLDDLLIIFYKNGLPSHSNCYVFNGDFVDRGKKSLEVLLILLACQVIYPGCVILNRGNHEDSIMNHRYGFTSEIHQKYRKNAEQLIKLIDQVYRYLPLATLINNKIFVVHGGISETTDLEIISKLNRSHYISILRPPPPLSSDENFNIEWKHVIDILWSDPVLLDSLACKKNKRGAGECFGPEITKKFLNRHNLDLLIRSHECKSEGYEILHNGNVITIFSASNYYEIGSNKGAYIKFGANLDRYFVQFTSAASKTKKLTFRQQVDIIEKSAIRELKGKLRLHKIELEREFSKRDMEGNGRLSVSQWSDAMESVTNFKLPWRLLSKQLTFLDENNEIIYDHTLRLIDSDEMKVTNDDSMLTDSIYTNRESLEAIFQLIDLDSNGLITMDEFKHACSLLSEYLPNYNVDQMIENCRMMDINRDSLVDLNEFLEAFRLCKQSAGCVSTSEVLINQNAEKNESIDPKNSVDLIQSYTVCSTISLSSFGDLRKEEIKLEEEIELEDIISEIKISN